MSLKYQLNCKQTFTTIPFKHKTLFIIPSLLFIVQLLSNVQFFGIPWAVAPQASLSFTTSLSLLKLMSTEVCGAMSPGENKQIHILQIL